MKKMFAIVLALMLCVSALSVAAFAAEGTEVTIVPHESWEAVYVYTWGGVDMGGWPGTQITADADGKYVVTINGTIEGMVIGSGDGKPQSIDIKDLDLTKDAALVTIGEAGDDGKHAYTISYDGGETTEEPEDNTTNDDTTTEDNTTTEQPATDAAYYVAGVEALCGVNWDPAAEANKMTKGEDGTYSITYTGVAAGSYELKVTAGNWDTCWGNSSGDNVKFTVDATADITVKFNPETGKITVLNGENPITGDMSLAAVSVALLAATAGLVVTVSKKKEF